METIAMTLGRVYRVLTEAEGMATAMGVFRCPGCGAEVTARFDARWGEGGAPSCSSCGNTAPLAGCAATLYCDEGVLERGGFNISLRCGACGGQTLVKFPEGSGVAWGSLPHVS